MSKKEDKFEPVPLPVFVKSESGYGPYVTATVNLKGDIGAEFEKMATDNNLNRSQLLRQMIYFCLGRKDELKDLAARAAMWR